MITLTIGQSVILSNGSLFTPIEESPVLYKGTVTLPGIFGFINVESTMIRSTGQVFDNLSNILLDTYEPFIKLPFGFPKVECDCGGFKTYKSMADHYHSRWCSVIKEAHGYQPIPRSS